jgi:monoterpene epsilon-lactone hydrolase
LSSRRARIVRWITSWYIQRIDVRTADVHKIRKRLDFIGRLLLRAFGVRVERTTIAGLYAEWLRPKRAPDDKVLLYLHGGAYVIGSCRSHGQMVSHIARAAGINALVPEYRLAPEHKFPAAIEDCVAVYRELLASGIRPENIVIAGDSAGGGLTVAMLLSLRDGGDPLPAAAVLLSPYLDVTASGESATTRADQDPWFHASDMEVVVSNYCGTDEVKKSLVSPVFAEVQGLPPVLIQVGDDEILLSDSTRFADKIRAAGGTVDIEIWPEMWHVFQLFVGKMPEARRAINKIGDYVRRLYSAVEPSKT